MNRVKQFYKHLIIFVAVGIIFNYAINHFFDHQKKNYLSVQTELLQTQYNTQYKYLKIMSKDIYSMYQDKHNLIELFTKAQDSNATQRAVIRDKMYNMLKKRYKRLQNMGIKQLHFHLKDNTSFLRMHKPSKFGDNLSAVRPSVYLVNSTLKPQEGFEVGKVSHGFRFVYPLFDIKHKHIGSMEVSFSSDQLIEQVTDKFVIDKHLLVLKSEIEKNMWKELSTTSYSDSLENSKYLVATGSYKKLDNREFHAAIENKKTLKTISLMMQQALSFSISSAYNYNALAVTFVPINSNIDKKNIAYLVLYAESDYLDTLLLEFSYGKLLFISLFILLFIFSIYVSSTQQRLERMAHFDKLTSLPNRAYFYIELEQEFKRAKRFKKKLSLMFIDLDGFKLINDSYGHNVGDDLLIETSNRLQKSIRGVDIVARIGGDEFIVLLTDIKDEESAIKVAQKIIDNLNKDFVINKNILNVGASIGIASFPKDSQTIDDLVSKADSAMYIAKGRGKNTFAVSTEENT